MFLCFVGKFSLDKLLLYLYLSEHSTSWCLPEHSTRGLHRLFSSIVLMQILPPHVWCSAVGASVPAYISTASLHQTVRQVDPQDGAAIGHFTTSLAIVAVVQTQLSEYTSVVSSAAANRRDVLSI